MKSFSGGFSVPRVKEKTISWVNNFDTRTSVPGGPVVKSSSLNVGDMGLISGLGFKIPHAEGQLCP